MNLPMIMLSIVWLIIVAVGFLRPMLVLLTNIRSPIKYALTNDEAVHLWLMTVAVGFYEICSGYVIV